MKLMPKGDILSLCDTVTNKLIAVENVTGMLLIYDIELASTYDMKLARIPVPFV